MSILYNNQINLLDDRSMTRQETLQRIFAAKKIGKMKRNSNGQASGILRDKTMHEKSVYIRNDNKQNYTVDCNYWFKSLNRPI